MKQKGDNRFGDVSFDYFKQENRWEKSVGYYKIRDYYLMGQEWFRAGLTIAEHELEALELKTTQMKGFIMGWLADEAVVARGLDLAPIGSRGKSHVGNGETRSFGRPW